MPINNSYNEDAIVKAIATALDNFYTNLIGNIDKQYRFEYRGGSIEDNNPVVEENGEVVPGILNSKGIQEHICEILEGGEQAFALRQHKYHFIKS